MRLTRRLTKHFLLMLYDFFNVNFTITTEGDTVITRVDYSGVLHIVQVPRFGIFPKSASRLVRDGWVECKILNFRYMYQFRAL